MTEQKYDLPRQVIMRISGKWAIKVIFNVKPLKNSYVYSKHFLPHNQFHGFKLTGFMPVHHAYEGTPKMSDKTKTFNHD